MAWSFDVFDDMLDYARTWNADLSKAGLEPIDDADVVRRARAVWRDREDGKIQHWQGQRAVAQVRADEARHLSAASRPGANALTLLALLRAEHGARSALGESFAICINAMVRDRVLGKWSARRLRNARNELLALGYIHRVRTGVQTAKGRTADQYAFLPRRPRTP
jgi:hypothetical protein